MASEPDPIGCYLTQLRKTEHLESTAVGENGAGPVHERMQAAQIFDKLVPRSQEQMIRIGKNDIGTNITKLIRAHCLYGALRSHRHECRGADRAPLCSKLACPCGAGICGYQEIHGCLPGLHEYGIKGLNSTGNLDHTFNVPGSDSGHGLPKLQRKGNL